MPPLAVHTVPRVVPINAERVHAVLVRAVARGCVPRVVPYAVKVPALVLPDEHVFARPTCTTGNDRVWTFPRLRPDYRPDIVGLERGREIRWKVPRLQHDVGSTIGRDPGRRDRKLPRKVE